MKKELKEKILISFVYSMIISIVSCLIAYIWNKNSVNVSFVKDIFSIVMSVIAPYIAILLFTDWKEQVKHEKSLTALIEVSAAFAKLHRAIVRLKLEKRHTNFNKNYKDDDFIKTIVEKRSDFDTEVDKITVTFDELDFATKTLYLVSERKDSPFKSVSDEYFKITHVWKDIYLRFLGEVNDGHNNEIEYIKIIKKYEYRLYYLQVRYDPHEDEVKNHNDEPIFLSMKYLKGLNDETNKLIEDFRESL